MSVREFSQAAKLLKQQPQKTPKRMVKRPNRMVKRPKGMVKRLRGKENQRSIGGNNKGMKWEISMYPLFINCCFALLKYDSKKKL